MMMQGLQLVRTYLDPTYLLSRNAVDPLSYHWCSLTHMSERTAHIQNRALRYIAQFFAFCCDATIGCGLVGSLVYNFPALVYNNTFVRVRNFKFWKSDPKWNETALNTWGVLIGIGLFHHLGGFRLFSSKTSLPSTPILDTTQLPETLPASASNEVTKIIQVVGGVFCTLVLFAAFCCRAESSKEESVFEKLKKAKTADECVEILGKTNVSQILRITSSPHLLYIPELNPREKEEILLHMQRIFGPNVAFAPTYQYSLSENLKTAKTKEECLQFLGMTSESQIPKVKCVGDRVLVKRVIEILDLTENDKEPILQNLQKIFGPDIDITANISQYSGS